MADKQVHNVVAVQSFWKAIKQLNAITETTIKGVNIDSFSLLEVFVLLILWDPCFSFLAEKKMCHISSSWVIVLRVNLLREGAPTFSSTFKSTSSIT